MIKKIRSRLAPSAGTALAVAAALMLTSCGGAPEEDLAQQQDAALWSIGSDDAGDETLSAGSDAADLSYAGSFSEGRYAYDTLDDSAKTVYDEILYAVENREESYRVSTTDTDEIELAYLAVHYDNCGLFYLEQLAYTTYTRNDEVDHIEINPVFSMTEKEQEAVQAQIDDEVGRMLSGMPDGTDYDKALYIYETLINEVDYVEGYADNQNIISVFLNHETICQGYAYATQYLLEDVGIPCFTVVGTALGESHAWNIALLDGAYYYIDTTWGNSQYVSQEGSGDTGISDTEKYVNYDYFCAMSDDFTMTHKPDERIALPECTEVADNYFIREGLYIQDWDPDGIGDILSGAYYDPDDIVQIKFSDNELLDRAFQYFIDEFHIADYCRDINSIRYIENTDNNVMYIQFLD